MRLWFRDILYVITIKKLCGLGISYIHSNIVVEIDKVVYLWCEICIKFCPDVADIMQLKEAKQRMYGKTYN